MKRSLEYVIVLALITGAVVVGIVAINSHRQSDKKSTLSAQTTNKPSPANKACAIFTLPLAKDLLGDTVKGGASATDSASQDMSVTSCSYSQTGNTAQTVSARQLAALTVNQPLTQDGITSNLNQFDRRKPAGVQDVTGYGDGAYWDPQHGQLNILKNNDWYVLSYGSPTPTDRSLDDAKKMADLLIVRL